MPSDREVLVDAFVRVRIALQHPDLSSTERAILEMDSIRGWHEDDVRASLCLTQREYRRSKSEALDKACVMPKPVKKPAPEPNLEAHA